MDCPMGSDDSFWGEAGAGQQSQSDFLSMRVIVLVPCIQQETRFVFETFPRSAGPSLPLGVYARGHRLPGKALKWKLNFRQGPSGYLEQMAKLGAPMGHH